MKQKLIPVEANPQLARDIDNNVILNVDRVSYRVFVEQKRRRVSKEQEIQDRLNNLQSQYDDLNRKLEILLQQTQGNDR